MIRFGNGISVALLGVVVGLPGCRGLPFGGAEALVRAHRNERSGNYVDALHGYQDLARAASKYGNGEIDTLRWRAAACLSRLGRAGQARHLLTLVRPEKLAPDDRRQMTLLRATLLLAGGRAAERRFVGPPLAEGAGIADAREAAWWYREAARVFGEVLKDDPESYEAFRGRGEALLRHGMATRGVDSVNQASTVLERCLQRRTDDTRARFAYGLSLLYGADEGRLTAKSGEVLVQALRQDRDVHHDLHDGYVDVWLYLSAFPTPPDVDRAFADPRVIRTVTQLVDLLDEYLATGHFGTDASSAVDAMRRYVATYRRWESDRDTAERAVALARKRLTETELGAIDRGRAALDLLRSVPPPFTRSTAYAAARTIVQTTYATSLLESSRRLIEVGERARPRAELAVVRDLLDGPWIPQPSPLRDELRELSAGLDALEEFDEIAARGRDLIRRNRPQDARAEFARYRRSLEGSPKLALVVRRLEAHERALDDATRAENVRSALRSAAIAEMPGDSSFSEAPPSPEAVRAFQSGDCGAALKALARRPQTTPADALLKATCLYDTGDYEAACGVLSSPPLDDTSFLAERDVLMAAKAFLGWARRSRRSSDRLARYRRARDLFEQANVPVETVREELLECATNIHRALTNTSVQDPREIAGALESLLALAPRSDLARRELAFALCEKGQRARSSLERRVDRQRAYHLLKELDEEGELRLPLHRERIYRRLLATYGDYLPLATGNRWVYRARNDLLRVVEVRGSRVADHYDVRVETGPDSREEVWRKTEGRVTRFDIDREGLPTRSIPIRLPAPDRTARWSYQVNGIRVEAEIIATGVARATPAGRFTRCITVRLKNLTTGDEFYYDFAPGIGEIRMESRNFYYELTEFQLASDR